MHGRTFPAHTTLRIEGRPVRGSYEESVMFCPNCGGHQSEGRKFCTSCGTNLLVISQVLSGRPTGVQSTVNTHDLERQRDLSKGVKFTIIGGAFLAIQFFGFVFSLPFRSGGSPFGFFSFVALVMMAIGISKIVSARPVAASGVASGAARTVAPPPHRAAVAAPAPAPIFEPPARTTDGLAAQHPGPSVTEDETQHLSPDRRNGKAEESAEYAE